MDKIMILAAVLLLAGCSTSPVPNIVIGGAESCPPATLTLNIINDTDKATVGDASNINDDDAGLSNPTLGL